MRPAWLGEMKAYAGPPMTLDTLRGPLGADCVVLRVRSPIPPPRYGRSVFSGRRSRTAWPQMARLISATTAATIAISEAVTAPVQKPLAQSSGQLNMSNLRYTG